MKLNLFWTREDLKLLPKTMKLVAQTIGESRIDKSSVDKIIENLKLANAKVSNRGCNDVPDFVEDSLTKEEWNKVWIEYYHYNGDLEEMETAWNAPLPDFCLFFFYITKFENIKSIPSFLQE